MIQRAAVLIGVEKTGGLPTLQAVRRGVEEMRTWALGQPGMGDRVTVLSDAEGRPVSVFDVKTAIRAYVDLGTIEQLVVYFAGHGVNNAYHEFWLLSQAPDDPDEAVNVDGSIALARYCGIPHVVLISDACRTAADSIQAQAVDGSLIFANTGPMVEPGCVDIFYAAAVGRPALEVRDVNAKTAGFQAVYTRTLVQSLHGMPGDLVDDDDGPLPDYGYVRPWPLKKHLQAAVPRVLTTLGVAAEISQSPDAVITSEPEAWVSAVALQKVDLPGGGFGVSTRGPAPKPPLTLQSASQRVLGAVLQGGEGVSAQTLEDLSRLPGGRMLGETLRRVSAVGDLGLGESRCGFQVRGVELAAAIPARGRVEGFDGPGGLVHLGQVAQPATQVLLVFADGRGALLPAIPDFLAALTYEEGELVNVTYEPSAHTWRWADLQGRLGELRELRGVIASAARLGVFRLEGEDAATLVGRMRAMKSVDPTLAVYAAYALDERQRRKEIESIERYLRGDLHLSLFDVALLAGRPQDPPRPMPADVFPAVPLLAQGWALLAAHGIALPKPLHELKRHVVDSLWTLFDPEGVAVLRAAIEAKEVP